MAKRIQESRLNKGHLLSLTALRRKYGNKLADEMFSKWLAEQNKLTAKADPHMLKLELAVAKLVKGGLSIPPSGIKITRSRHGISVNKIAMKRKQKKRKTKKAATKK